ncbi:Uncharacterised protein [Candidatus Burarchaeum australiense]|nr:Uncharacterised protein [Candidatus Burarchaeum australiense]
MAKSTSEKIQKPAKAGKAAAGAPAKSAAAGIAPPAASGGRRRICIICQQEKAGAAVRDDFFIRTVRAVKKTLGIATNNVLVVCKECEPEHQKRRGAFEKTLLQYGAIGIVIGLVILFLSFNLTGLVVALLMAGFILSFAITRYHPASEAK